MPVVQATGGTQPQTTQLNLRQMVGEVLQWNPDAPEPMVRRWLANTYRKVIDHRHWYGALVRGQVTVPDAVSGGTVTVTEGNTTVTGVGTAFIADMVGRQFRIGFSNPIYTIDAVNSATELILDLPWGGKTTAGVAYIIFQNIVSLGANIKMPFAMVNQRQGYRLHLGMPQEVLNIYDTWRTTTGWTFLLASNVPSKSGEPLFELYPAPTFQQAFPFLAFTQPKDLVEDGDFPVAFVRSDIIVMGGISQALRFRGKESKYYDPNQANYFEQVFQMELQKMASVDNDLYQRDLRWEYNAWPFSKFGSDWHQAHDVDSFTL